MLRERMLLMHAAFANVAFDGNTLTTLRGLVSQRKRDGHIGPRAAVDCEATIQPMDISPIRSPLAVHTVLARRFAGKDVVEIGTRMGDAIACFAMVARTAVAVEVLPKYCKALANRTSRANTHAGSFGIACGDYRNASLDADYITWWQQAPGLVNEPTLSHLHQELMAGRIRRGASALVLFDPSESEDASSFEQIRSANRNSRAVEGVELVEYDAVRGASPAQATLEEEREVAELRSCAGRFRGCQHSPRPVCLTGCGGFV